MERLTKLNQMNEAFENFSFGEKISNSYELFFKHRLWYLSFLLVIALTIFGNMMVVLAVAKNKKLQNTTNYFLMSLALADMLVAILVMPLSLWSELIGYFPFGKIICILWMSGDIFLCTCSIWHMCLMSMDRFFTIRFPLKYGRNKTRKLMMIKISLVWLISCSISIPLLVLGYQNPADLFTEENLVCALNHSQFKLYGSIFAFYIPFLIIAITYSFTIFSLKKIIKKKELCVQSNKSEKKLSLFSNFFFNSDKSSNSMGNSDTKHRISVNPPGISRNNFSEISSKKENFFDQFILKTDDQTIEEKPIKLHLTRSKSDSKINKSLSKILICRSESNALCKKYEKLDKSALKPLNTKMNEKSQMYRKCKNLCEFQSSGDQKEMPILILTSNRSDNELNPEHSENRIRKNSNVSFGSFSFLEYHNPFKEPSMRKTSQNISLLSRISGKSKKKSNISSADLILRSNSLFSSSTKQQIKMYNKQNNEEKALKVLMIIFSMFVLFWSPFFIYYLAWLYFFDDQPYHLHHVQ
ncbi:5-hydroxytryptamine receptor 2A [Brachionus plicatilis]|uniref:5-hydroxytryptamine receptor 2A n=1 Tax=Brachionus plicatilis TaxID=10195 RepID=A0A3M7SZ47_BRAPC|nr:5-hydroxytryptamine receptor 2A [Brachionus plicatilis]